MKNVSLDGFEDGASRPWRKDDFEPEWMKKLRASHPEVLEARAAADEAAEPAPAAEAELEVAVDEAPLAGEEPQQPLEAPLFQMSDADTAALPDNVEARDLCSCGSGSARRYTAAVRLEALQYFEKGWGYKATAGFLHLPYYTVRAWKRLFKQGKFSRERIEVEIVAEKEGEAPLVVNYVPKEAS